MPAPRNLGRSLSSFCLLPSSFVSEKPRRGERWIAPGKFAKRTPPGVSSSNRSLTLRLRRASAASIFPQHVTRSILKLLTTATIPSPPPTPQPIPPQSNSALSLRANPPPLRVATPQTELSAPHPPAR